MQSIALTILFLFLVLQNLVSGLGINCQGCPSGMSSLKKHVSIAQQLTSYIGAINQSQWYEDVDLIGCVTGIDDQRVCHVCAYLQNTGGAPGSKILELARYLPDHGCHACGSVPFSYPSDNDASNGELTYIIVDSPCSGRDGLCTSGTVGAAKTSMLSILFIVLIISLFVIPGIEI